MIVCGRRREEGGGRREKGRIGGWGVGGSRRFLFVVGVDCMEKGLQV